MADLLTWRVRAKVRRIVDGDTFVADLDLGWGVWRLETVGAPSRVRLLNYDAPEKADADYAQAIAALAAVLPVDSEVWLTSHRLDSFGRALCDVQTKDGVNILDLLPQQWRKT